MDRLDCDRMLVAVADAGSFARGAARLNVSPAQASKLIARLEAELGVRLFDRTTRKLALTEAGRGYVERVRPLLEEFAALDAAMHETAEEPAGTLRISVPLAYGVVRLTPLLTAFAIAHPKIMLDVDFSDRVARLVDEGFDVAVRIGEVSDLSLISRRIGKVGVAVVASPAFLAASQTITEPSDLTSVNCVIDSNFRDPLNWTFRNRDSKALLNVAVSGRLRLSNAEACLAAAMSGLGVARVPDFNAQPYIEAGKLVEILHDHAPPGLPVFVLYPPSRYVTRKLRVFVDYLAAAMTRDETASQAGRM